MSELNHTHTDDIIVDANEDAHFIINTTTREISMSNASNKKLTIMQYDKKSERYSFDIDKIIDGHDLTKCNRVQIHFTNIGSNRLHNDGTYPVDDVQVNLSDENKLTFTWLVGEEATQYNGMLSFLVTFECVDGDEILYRWSSSIYKSIQIAVGMDNNNTVFEVYSDELLKWQNKMELEYIPIIVDQRYINRDFATSEEVGAIFNIYNPAEDELIGIDGAPTDNSKNLVESGGVKSYVDSEVDTIKTYVDDGDAVLQDRIVILEKKTNDLEEETNVLNDELEDSLKLPTSTPSQTQLVSVDTKNKQKMLNLGDDFIINNDTVALSGGTAKSDLSNVTYPEIVYDTQTKLFDGETHTGAGDRVIKSYVSSDGLAWSRVWASGWKECGAEMNTQSKEIYFPEIEFSTTHYVVTGVGINIAEIGMQSITKYKDRFVTTSAVREIATFSYYACGY